MSESFDDDENREEESTSDILANALENHPEEEDGGEFIYTSDKNTKRIQQETTQRPNNPCQTRRMVSLSRQTSPWSLTSTIAVLLDVADIFSIESSVNLSHRRGWFTYFLPSRGLQLYSRSPASQKAMHVLGASAFTSPTVRAANDLICIVFMTFAVPDIQV
ncbi:hypothetical protein NMY22_g9126 [Coprinellus aureogranulatus]|nr:hypothetical protein NMY22_g9126 [Coprinellus aureogranulatus]